jgi:ketosteroid isomerase-like protein
VPRGVDPVREFIRSFNDGDLDAFVAVLDPEVEIHSMRGMRKGPGAARVWATRAPGGVQQAIVLDELYEDTDRAVALITRRWRWAEDDSHAGEDEMAWLFELRDGRVRSWRPFEDRAEALHAGGFEHGTGAG